MMGISDNETVFNSKTDRFFTIKLCLTNDKVIITTISNIEIHDTQETNFD